MKFDLPKSLEILERTPQVLEHLLSGVSGEWIESNEGDETWSPFDVVGHLIHGEKTDWIQRMQIMLSDSGDKKFTPFDRFAQFRESKGKTMADLLTDFKTIRSKNIALVRSWNLTAADFLKKGIHPVFGEVALEQLLSTWMVHDMNHLAQIARVIAKQYKTEVGPWVEYLRILKN